MAKYEALSQTHAAGGRVLGVTATGENLAAAIDLAYQAVSQIHWEGVYFRRDIGHKAAQTANRGSA